MNNVIGLVLCGATLTLGACAASDSDIEDGENDMAGGKADSITEGSAQARAILALVNNAEVDQHELDVDAKLSLRAARNIILHRNGTDGRAGTFDDKLFTDLAGLDAISYVGPATMKALLVYATQKGLLDMTTVRLPLLLDEGNHDFIASMNAKITMAGREAMPKFVLANADERAQVEKWFQEAMDLYDIDINFYGTASPSDYSVADVGAAKGMCYTGDGGGVAAVIQSLADQPFTEMLVVYAWKFGGQTFYNEDWVTDDETRQSIDDGLAEEDAWKNYDPSSDDVVFSQTTGDGGDDLTAVRVPKCTH